MVVQDVCKGCAEVQRIELPPGSIKANSKAETWNPYFLRPTKSFIKRSFFHSREVHENFTCSLESFLKSHWKLTMILFINNFLFWYVLSKFYNFHFILWILSSLFACGCNTMTTYVTPVFVFSHKWLVTWFCFRVLWTSRLVLGMNANILEYVWRELAMYLAICHFCNSVWAGIAIFGFSSGGCPGLLQTWPKPLVVLQIAWAQNEQMDTSGATRA